MPLVITDDHPAARALPRAWGAALARTVRIGVINVMPQTELYEPFLLTPLSKLQSAVAPVFIRLATHDYRTSERAHLERFYRPFDRVLAEGPLHGLILTGAPVEELRFEDVRYWGELREILAFARSKVASTLGLCWGAMALGQGVGLQKVSFGRKLFGVFENDVLVPRHPLLSEPGGRFPCAHSRHSGFADPDLRRAEEEGRVRLLSHGAETGYSVLETPDHRTVMHLGHPEYEGTRLAVEWARDQELGRADVDAPRNFDPEAPATPWAGHRHRFFGRWVELLEASTRDNGG